MMSTMWPRNAISARSEPSAPFARNANRNGRVTSTMPASALAPSSVPVLPRTLPSRLALSWSTSVPALPGDRTGRRARRELGPQAEVDRTGEERTRRPVALVEARAVDHHRVLRRQPELGELLRDRLRCRQRSSPVATTRNPISRVSISEPRLSLVLSSSPTTCRSGGDEIFAISTAPCGACSRLGAFPTLTPRASSRSPSFCAANTAGSSTRDRLRPQLAEASVHGERADRTDLTIGAVVGVPRREVAEVFVSRVVAHDALRDALHTGRDDRVGQRRERRGGAPPQLRDLLAQRLHVGRHEQRITAAHEEQPVDGPVLRCLRGDHPRVERRVRPEHRDAPRWR